MYFFDSFILILLLIPVLGFILSIVALVKIGNLRLQISQQLRDLQVLRKEFDEVQKQRAPGKAPPAETTKDAPKPAEKPATPEVETPTEPEEEPAAAEPPRQAAARATAEPAKSAPATPPTEPARPTIVDRVMDNIIANWVIWLAALSLALGGVFIVQYGIEKGYLGPVARVIGALLFGTALIGGAEYMRRKDPEHSSSYFSVPVALASGGIASLFAGVVAAHVLYDLTNALVGFASMAIVSWLALAGGLIYGPVLAVIGLLGAYVSPLLVASAGATPLMYLYFLLVMTACMTVERMQRWIWLSSLAMAGTLIWGVLLHDALPQEPYLALYTIGAVLIAVALPAFGIPPKSEDTGWVTPESFGRISYVYPTILAAGTALAATVLLVLTSPDSLIIWQVSILSLLALSAIGYVLFAKAQNLDQLAGIFVLGVIAVVSGVGALPGSEAYYLFGAEYDQVIRKYFPFAALSVLGLSLICLVGCIWRTPRSVRPGYWAAMAALLPLAALIILWGKWHHTKVLTDGNWQVLFAILTATVGGTAAITLRRGDKLLASADILASGAFLGFGCLAYLGLSDTQQIVALPAIAVSAFLVEARYGFRFLGLISLGYTSLSFWRLVMEPGLDGARYASILEGPGYTAVAAALFYAGAVWANKVKSQSRLMQFETAAVAAVGILLSILISRMTAAGLRLPEQAQLGLHVTVWLMLAQVQFKRAQLVDGLKKLRLGFGWAYFGLSALAMLAGVFFLDPAFGIFSERVKGVFPFDSIMIAYALPVSVLVASLYFSYLPDLLPRKFGLPVAGVTGVWVLILQIRRFWHGNDLSRPTVLTPELYTYTVVLLIATAACVTAALWRKEERLRKWGLGLAGLTAFKVFLWDMAGLQGLGRATSFIALGLTLAGIAWLFQHFSMEPRPARQNEEGPWDHPDES